MAPRRRAERDVRPPRHAAPARREGPVLRDRGAAHPCRRRGDSERGRVPLSPRCEPRGWAAARAAHDYLYTQHDGQVSAELHIVSIDLVSKTIVVSRNSHCPVIFGDEKGVKFLNQLSEAIGVHRRMKPVITELPLKAQTTLVAFTDGVLNAGVRSGHSFDTLGFVKTKLQDENISAPVLADAVLSRAVELDSGRPCDDASVLVIRVVPRQSDDAARRMAVRFPIE